MKKTTSDNNNNSKEILLILDEQKIADNFLRYQCSNNQNAKYFLAPIPDKDIAEINKRLSELEIKIDIFIEQYLKDREQIYNNFKVLGC